MLAQLIPQGLCPLGVIEQTDLMVTEIACHGARITNIGKGAGDDDTVEAGKYGGNFLFMALYEGIHGNGLPVGD